MPRNMMINFSYRILKNVPYDLKLNNYYFWGGKLTLSLDIVPPFRPRYERFYERRQTFHLFSLLLFLYDGILQDRKFEVPVLKENSNFISLLANLLSPICCLNYVDQQNWTELRKQVNYTPKKKEGKLPKMLTYQAA